MGSASVTANGWNSTTFTVENIADETAEFNLDITSCGGALAAGSCSSSPSSGTLSQGQSMSVTVYFAGGPAAGTGTITLAAISTSGGPPLSSESVNVTVVAASHAPTISLSPHLGDRLDVSQCVADCFETTLSYTTPAYVSRDVPRSVTLLYRSGRAYPHGKLTLDVSDAAAPAGSKFRLQLLDPNGSYVTFTNGAQAVFFSKNSTGPTRIAAQFNASQIATSAAVYTAHVTSVEPNGSMAGMTAAPVRIIIINESNSPYGAGVDLVGLQRLSTAQTGGVLITDGSGSATFFAGSCNAAYPGCTFSSPAGEFSTLKTIGGSYQRRYPDGTVVTFNAWGQQTSTADRFGNTTTVSYVWNASYSVSVPFVITDPTGKTIAFWFRQANTGDWVKGGSLGNIHVSGRDVPIGIDQANDLRHWCNANATYFALADYDGLHRLIKVTNHVGAVTDFAYAYAATPSHSDAPSVKLASGSITRPRTSLREPASVLLEAAALGGGTPTGTPIAAATASALRASLTDPNNNTTYLTINRFGAPEKIEAPISNPSYAAYDSVTGQIKRTQSSVGDVVRYTWVGDQLRVTADSTAGRTINIEYEASYSLPKHIYGDVAEQTLTYDQTKPGWPLKTLRVGPTSATATTYLTDPSGRFTTVTDPKGHATTYVYSQTGFQNFEKSTAPNGQSTTYAVDGYGRTVSSTNPYGHTSRVGLDLIDRASVHVDQANDTTKFQYDVLNNPTVVTDAKGQLYTSQRNVLGWIDQQVDPALRADSSKYDAAGNVVYTRSRGGRVVRREYDALNRPTKLFSTARGDTITYEYDPAGRWVAARAFNANVLVSIDTTFTDSVGRKVKEATHRPNVGSWSVSTSYHPTEPDRVGIAVTRTQGGTPAHGGHSLSYTYDGRRRLGAIWTGSGAYTQFGYNADGQVDTVRFPSNLKEVTTYTSSHAVAGRSYNVSTVQGVLGRAYRSDSLARVVRRSEASGVRFQTFSYNPKGQLEVWTKKSAGTPPGCIESPDYGADCSVVISSDSVVTSTYDKVGNPTTLGATVDPGNRLRTFDGVTMTYDDDGNMLTRSDGGVVDTYGWDDFGQLKSVTRGNVLIATFDYDGFGRRIRKTATTQGVTSTIRYIWDGEQIVTEADGSGTEVQSYSYYPGVDRLHAVLVHHQGGATTKYYSSIEQGGDVNGLVRESDNAVVAQYAYTPWGGVAMDTSVVTGLRLNSLRWRGLPYDAETGLYHVRARYYDPKTRRFISEDPIGLGGGINDYVYASNDPINRTDPSGLDDECISYWVNGYTISSFGKDGMNAVTTEVAGYRVEYCEDPPDVVARTPDIGGSGGYGGGASVAIAGSLVDRVMMEIRLMAHPPTPRKRHKFILKQFLSALGRDPEFPVQPPPTPGQASTEMRSTRPGMRGVTIRYLPSILGLPAMYDVYRMQQEMTYGTPQYCNAHPIGCS